jgi:outer membrane lipoprotein-sorting protein
MRSTPSITLIAFVIFTGSGMPILCQDFLTPTRFFDDVSQRFGQIKDYEALINIDQNEGELVMSGSIIYKSPNKLRIDFTSPEEQVLSMDGEMLVIYIPKYSYILEQKLKRHSQSTLALMASSQELTYLKNNYSVAYLVGPEPVPLEEGSQEMVIKLKFQSHSAVKGYKQLEIAFDMNGMIRRVVGNMANGTIVMDFENIVTNQGIPDARFEYESPVNANVYKDFLFEGMD